MTTVQHSLTQALEQDGYIVFPVVRAFLQRFGGLTLKHRISYRGQRLTQLTDFDPVAATAGTDPGLVQRYAEYLGSPLCIVGSISNKHATLLMSSEGKVYSTYDNLVFWGNTGEQAIDHVCCQQRGVLLLDE